MTEEHNPKQETQSTVPGWKRALSIPAAVIAVLAVVNPSAGIIEAIPDNLPFIGNLDEAFFTGVLYWCYRQWRPGK